MDDVQNVTCDLCVSNLLWANLILVAICHPIARGGERQWAIWRGIAINTNLDSARDNISVGA